MFLLLNVHVELSQSVHTKKKKQRAQNTFATIEVIMTWRFRWKLLRVGLKLIVLISSLRCKCLNGLSDLVIILTFFFVKLNLLKIPEEQEERHRRRNPDEYIDKVKVEGINIKDIKDDTNETLLNYDEHGNFK